MSDQKVPFKLVGISTDEFALFEDQYQEGGADRVQILPELSFGIAPDKQGVVVHVTVRMEQDERPFLKLQCACSFQIEENAWEEFKKDEGKSLELPKGFARHLGVLTVGTARGILHAKTENTPFNRFFLRTMDLTQVIEEPVVFE